MNANEILRKHEDANEMHFHEVDRKWIIEAMEEYGALRQKLVTCWACQYCDKESVLKGDKWVLTRTGYCLAQNSAVNGENDFYKKVYVNTAYKECSQFEPCS